MKRGLLVGELIEILEQFDDNAPVLVVYPGDRGGVPTLANAVEVSDNGGAPQIGAEGWRVRKRRK
jgi:hypothetical protein